MRQADIPPKRSQDLVSSGRGDSGVVQSVQDGELDVVASSEEFELVECGGGGGGWLGMWSGEEVHGSSAVLVDLQESSTKTIS